MTLWTTSKSAEKMIERVFFLETRNEMNERGQVRGLLTLTSASFL